MKGIPVSSVETMLEQTAHDLLQKGSGMPEPLARVLRETGARGLLSLSLDSIHGPFLSLGSAITGPDANERNLKALPALSDEQKNEKRFFFSMTDRQWIVLSAFSLDTQPFFTKLTLDITDPAGAPIRAGLFKLADYFTVKCRKLLQSFISDLAQRPAAVNPAASDISFERCVLEKIISFSPRIQSAVVLDEDGSIIHTEGFTGQVDQLAGALAPLFYRSNYELARLECTDCTAVTITDHEYTIRVGKLPNMSLALAISATGPHANAYVHFLHAAASTVLSEYAWRTGHLWGIALAEVPLPSRIRTSWFDSPQLVPQGRFVAKKGGNLYHTTGCRILTRTDTALLTWFEDRDVAAISGLRPCGACNP
jgi:hypothetical protein